MRGARRWSRSRCRGRTPRAHPRGSSRTRRRPCRSGVRAPRALALALRRGYVLLIDYGSVEGPAGPVHGYREHREVADVLADPGGTDITAGVDVSMIADRARSVGLPAFEPVTQQAALRALGHDRWQQTMRATQTELQRAGRDAEAVRVWEERSRASLLTDPSRFGGFWWLVLATEGLPEPRGSRARAHATPNAPRCDRFDSDANPPAVCRAPGPRSSPWR